MLRGFFVDTKFWHFLVAELHWCAEFRPFRHFLPFSFIKKASAAFTMMRKSLRHSELSPSCSGTLEWRYCLWFGNSFDNLTLEQVCGKRNWMRRLRKFSSISENTFSKEGVRWCFQNINFGEVKETVFGMLIVAEKCGCKP